MSDPKNLPYLLRLLDDPSEVVRTVVARELSAFGPGLDASLNRLGVPPDSPRRKMIRELVQEHRRAWLRASWPRWNRLSEDKERLESALALIAAFQDGPCLTTDPAPFERFRLPLSERLDGLAREFRSYRSPVGSAGTNAISLARFLFEVNGLAGDRTNYYSPYNSNLVRVIETRRGIPISLACIYILVGYRLAMPVEGCNWPGHFLARTILDGVPMVVDCFNRGQCQDEESFLKMQGPSRAAAKAVLAAPASAESIILRVLHNLLRAYQQSGERTNAQLMVELAQKVDRQP